MHKYMKKRERESTVKVVSVAGSQQAICLAQAAQNMYEKRAKTRSFPINNKHRPTQSRKSKQNDSS